MSQFTINYDTNQCSYKSMFGSTLNPVELGFRIYIYLHICIFYIYKTSVESGN